MAQCVVVGVDGVLQASGSDPCTGLVVLTPAEYAVFSTNPLMLSSEDGALVSGAIVGAWSVAWVFRALVRVLNSDTNNED